MKLIKIGDRMVNMDRVTNLIADDSGVSLYFGGEEGETQLVFDGKDGQALRRWLDTHAEDVTRPPAVKPVRKNLG